MFKWLYGPILITKKLIAISTYAAALAYNVVLSMVPFLAVTFVLGLQISTQLHLGADYAKDFIRVFNEIIPDGQNQVVTETEVFEN